MTDHLDFSYWRSPALTHPLWCASHDRDRACDCREPRPTTADLLDRIDADPTEPASEQETP